jgi:dTDP-4-amino-4,6-dideoxygalactose transaminase
MIPLYRPFYNHRELVAALRPGPARQEFESALAARAGARYGLTFAYGRAVLLAVLKALGITQAEVILPAYTCRVIARSVVASDNYPRFADIDLADYNMDLDALKSTLTPQTRAVVATHMYGYPADVDAIRAVVGDERVLIVEDSALGLHTLSAGGQGLRGDLGLYSLAPGKPLSTYEGGVMVTNSSQIYEKVRAYRDQELNQRLFKAQAKRWARLVASFVMFREGIYGLWHRQGAKSGLGPLTLRPANHLPEDIAMAWPNFQARVGLAQLQKLELMLAQRRELAALYDRELGDAPGLSKAPIIPGATYAYYTVRLPRRDELDFARRMFAQGVAVDQTYDYAVPNLKSFQPFAGGGEYPRAAQAAREVVNLPLYPGLSAASARYVAECARRALRGDLAG